MVVSVLFSACSVHAITFSENTSAEASCGYFETCKMIALAGYKPYKKTDIGGHLICAWTREKYSHVELIIDTNLDLSKPKQSYSSSIRDKGVRTKPILFNDHWDVFPLDADEKYALSVFNRFEGQPYGWLDLIAQHVLRLPVRNGSIVCSELALLMLGVDESIANSLNPGQAVRYFKGKL